MPAGEAGEHFAESGGYAGSAGGGFNQGGGGFQSGGGLDMGYPGYSTYGSAGQPSGWNMGGGTYSDKSASSGGLTPYQQNLLAFRRIMNLPLYGQSAFPLTPNPTSPYTWGGTSIENPPVYSPPDYPDNPNVPPGNRGTMPGPHPDPNDPSKNFPNDQTSGLSMMNALAAVAPQVSQPTPLSGWQQQLMAWRAQRPEDRMDHAAMMAWRQQRPERPGFRQMMPRPSPRPNPVVSPNPVVRPVPPHFMRRYAYA